MNAIQDAENIDGVNTGDYTAGGIPLPSVATLRADKGLMARYEAKIDKGDGGQDACWLWTASTDEKGYGRFRVYRRTCAAHRFAYALANGRWPSPTRMVMHSCDNPRCVNPAHLSEGTAVQNNRDAVEKGHHQNAYTKDEKEPRERTHLELGFDTWRTGPTENMLRGSSRLTAYDVLQIRQQVKEQAGESRRISRTLLASLAGQYGVKVESVRRAALGQSFAWVTSQHGAGAGGTW